MQMALYNFGVAIGVLNITWISWELSPKWALILTE